MKRWVPRPEWLLAAIGALGVAIVNSCMHGWFLLHYNESVGFDDGHIAAFATRLIQNHWLPYVDAICHRGPLLYWYAAFWQKIFGPYSWVGLRAGTLATAVLTTGSAFFAGSAARRPLAGAVAGGVYSYMSVYGMPPGAGLSPGGEHVAVPLALAAAGWIALAMNFAKDERRRLVYLVLGGACACLSMLAKQTSALLLFPLIAWVIAWGFGSDVTARKTALLRVLALFGGWALVAGLVLGLYAAHGALGTFFYWFFTYNKDIYMAPYHDADRGKAVLAWINDNNVTSLAIALTLGSALLSPLFELDSFRPRRLLAAYQRAGFQVTSGVIGSLNLVSALATMRFWPHYFLIVVPWVGMLVGLRIEQILLASPSLGRRLGYAGVAGLVVAVAGFGTVRRLANMTAEQRSGSWAPARPDAICDAVDRYTKPDEGMFVWGFDADLYISCARRPITRYVTSHFVAGVVPPFWNQPNADYVAKDSRATVAAEINAARPPLILDNESSLPGFPMHRVPELGRILKHDYCSLGAVSGRGGRTVQVYLRKDRPECAGK